LATHEVADDWLSKPAPKPCLVACSVLKNEIDALKQQGLDVDVVFVPKYFHVDYDLLEKNLRRTLTQTQKTHSSIVLVYGDLCLGPNGEMKQLASQYGIVKVDALNCIDCLLGGKGNVEQQDPAHELMFFGPGMIEFFQEMHAKLKNEGVDESAFKKMFEGIKGIVLLDPLGNAEQYKAELEALHTGLAVLEVRNIGLNKLKQVLKDALKRAREMP
jgi:hypothetical protein